MKFRHPLVLLLGGLLSASGIGCSAITAVVSDSRPAAHHGRDSAGQMTAIARVFENQGRYSQAEMMYRKALKHKPNDPTIRTQLAQLAERQKGKSFEADPVKNAIAAADRATSAPSTGPNSAAKAQSPSPGPASVAASPKMTGELPSTGSAISRPAPKVPATIVSSTVHQSATVNAEHLSVAAAAPNRNAPVKSASEHNSTSVAQQIDSGLISPISTAAGLMHPAAGQVTTVSAVTESRTAELNSQIVTVEDILSVVDSPADHSDLLLRGLRYGDSLEAQCLAATLMGDCRPDDQAIRKSLETASHSAKDAYLRLAICDSRIQRNEHDASTAACLVSLVENGPLDIRIQACSALRHFSSTESQSLCVKTLETSLESDSPDLRAAAAVTLGDFEQLSPTTVTRLVSIARSDSSEEAREAAKAATARYEGRTPETAMTLTPLGE